MDVDVGHGLMVAHRPRTRHVAPARRRPGDDGRVFLLFSNRLGCAGSVLVSLIGTVVVIALLVLLF
ncbi:MAG: hypothetical protein ACFCVF_14935 [Kineosporiaceae bacterium]